MRYRAIVEYDGTNFYGYQVQKNVRTVQGELEKALNFITCSFVRVDAAGRTDTGVHAVGQVIAFNSSWQHTTDDLWRALNAVLPSDITVGYLVSTRSTFSPRFDAICRSYRYTILNQPSPSALNRYYSYYVRHRLDFDSMVEAAECFLGRQDFASFGKSPSGNDNTVRHVFQTKWSRIENTFYFDIVADAFLYRMVRNIVGTLIEVGLGHLTLGQVETILKSRCLSNQIKMAPACGLCLTSVTYPDLD